MLALCLATVLGSPGALAQEPKTELVLRLFPGDYFSGIPAGKSTTIFMEVRNTGTRAITNIRLNASKPEGWSVYFNPVSIGYLAPGSAQTVDINVIPAGDTSRRDYNITLIAEANETRTVTSAFLRVVQSGPSAWLWVGIGLAALVIAGFAFVFIRMGRQ